MPLDFNILGKGIYSPRQAARLVGGKPQEIVRWTRGSGAAEPLWHAYYQSLDDTTELSFADLVEVRVVKAFRSAGISLQAIRFAINFAEEKYGVERPLSTLRFKTDGREILHEAFERDGEMVSLSKRRAGQKVFSEIAKQSLRDLEYDEDTAARWRPSSAKHVVIDPKRQFGAPLIDEYGVSTGMIFSEYKCFQNIDYLAKIYEIPQSVVVDAIAFEDRLDNNNING